MPALLAAFLHAHQTALSVMGMSALQPFSYPGNNQVFGFIQRQYSRRVSSSLGLSGTSRSRPPLPFRMWITLQAPSMSLTFREQISDRRMPVHGELPNCLNGVTLRC